MMKQEPPVTVGTLIEHLSSYDRDMQLDFSGLEFLRLKKRGEDLVQVEFSQSVYRDEDGNVVIQNLDSYSTT